MLFVYSLILHLLFEMNGSVERNGFPRAEPCGLGEPPQNSTLHPNGNGNIASTMEDPICIVGMGKTKFSSCLNPETDKAYSACRLPGGVDSPDRFWEFLANKKSGQGRVPPDRFNIQGYYKAGVDLAGVLNADGGYFIKQDLRQFENSFFNINNLEATYMDPQQRKLLEVVYECFENAGVSMKSASGTNTGVYVGSFTMDYSIQQGRDPDYSHRYSATGISSNTGKFALLLMIPPSAISTPNGLGITISCFNKNHSLNILLCVLVLTQGTHLSPRPMTLWGVSLSLSLGQLLEYLNSELEDLTVL